MRNRVMLVKELFLHDLVTEVEAIPPETPQIIIIFIINSVINSRSQYAENSLAT